MNQQSNKSGVNQTISNESNVSGIGRATDMVRDLLIATLEQSGPEAFCEMLFERADQLRATDIHLDPSGQGTLLRLRIDGFMLEVATLKEALATQVMSRIKLLAGMDITDRRLAQDGHLPGVARKGKADIRIGTGPTIHGERLVMRLMPDPTALVDIGTLGLSPDQQLLIRGALQSAGGMILVVGPVGSGKSTTTYACLSILNRPELSTVTIEDPVERRLLGANQIQTDPRIDFGFLQALRGVLRQDPDVIMIGEIRDPETANIAVRASLTGVKVMSTLHASDCSTVIDVLRQFGIPPIFVAESLKCVIAQRLVRLICPHHREAYKPSEFEAELLNLTPAQAATTKIWRGIPTPKNYQTGYDGRSGIFELLMINEPLRKAIIRDNHAESLNEIAQANGLITLRDSAIRAVLDGKTTIPEMIRILPAY